MLAFYVILLSILSSFGLHRLMLAFAYKKSLAHPPKAEDSFSELPAVTIQLPIYNERAVKERLIRSVCRIDYPKEKLEVQVLDDSTDGSLDISRKLVSELSAEGFNIVLINRTDRKHYKAGALAHGLKTATGEFIAVFDADFVPKPDFLLKTINFFSDKKIGMVQVRWGYLNRFVSLLTRGQAALLDGHFQIEHTARNRLNCFFNFNGTAGIWRKEAIIDAGNWQGDTITEDLDLSYRAQLVGYKFVYLVDHVAPSELPVAISAFKSQQHRWTLGSIQVFKKLFWRILLSRCGWRVKLEAFAHLGANLCYPLLVTIGLVLVPLGMFDEYWSNKLMPLFSVIFFTGGMLSVLIFYSVAVRHTMKSNYLYAFREALIGLTLGIGLSLSNTIAVFEGLVGRKVGFLRTPKFGTDALTSVKTKKVERASQWRAWLVVPETLLFTYFLLGLLQNLSTGRFSTVIFIGFFVLGFGYFSFKGIGSIVGSYQPRQMVPAKRTS